MDFRNEFNTRINRMGNISDDDIKSMHDISSLLIQVINNGNKVLTAGNGGNAANAQHITGDIVGRFKYERRGFAGVSLTVDPSVMTAICNDYGYEYAFARQVEGIGNSGDALIVLSSSATSLNLNKAVEKAKEIGIHTIGILGDNGGDIGEKLDKCITFPFKESDLVEELSMSMFHIILMETEKELINSKERM